MKVVDIIQIFHQSMIDYHVTDNVDAVMKNPFASNTLDALLYHKNWVDTVQWHFEDLTRTPNINPDEGVNLKKRIDQYNIYRIELVEKIEDIYFDKYKNVQLKTNYRLNTETIGWALDRMSVLCLKIYHMNEELKRIDASIEHKNKCTAKLNILLQQQTDLSLAITQLEDDIKNGLVKMLLYRQMKMYNDPNLNPILYKNKK